MQSFNSFLLFANGVRVEQTLGGMFMRAVAGVDHARTQTLGQELGRAGAAMAQDNDIDMIRFQNLSGVLQSFAFAQARSGGRNVDHVRAQPKSSQLERSASACTRFDKKINERFPPQRRYFFDFACAYLLEGISGVENKIDFIDRQLAQPEQIFAVPARRRHKQVAHTRTLGSTRVPRVGESVSLSRTFLGMGSSGKDCFGERPKPTRETGALPGLPRRYRPRNLGAFILSPAKRLRSTPLRPSVAALFRRARSVSFSQRNPPESAIRDDRDRSGLRAEFSPAGQKT